MGTIDWHESVRGHYINYIERMWNNAFMMTSTGPADGKDYVPDNRFDFPDQYEVMTDPGSYMGSLSASGDEQVYELLKDFLSKNMELLINAELMGVSAAGEGRYTPPFRSSVEPFWDQVVSLFGTVSGTSWAQDYISTLYDAHEQRVRRSVQREAIPDLEAVLGYHGAAIGSDMTVARSSLWEGFTDAMDEFDATLVFQTRAQFDATRTDLVKAGMSMAPMMVAMDDLQARVSMQKVALIMDKLVTAVKLGHGVGTDTASLKMKYNAVKAEQGWRHWFYPMEVWNYLGDALGSLPAGGPYKPARDNVVANVLAGALTGAAIGGEIGGRGATGIGSFLGAVAGYFAD